MGFKCSKFKERKRTSLAELLPVPNLYQALNTTVTAEFKHIPVIFVVSIKLKSVVFLQVVLLILLHPSIVFFSFMVLYTVIAGRNEERKPFLFNLSGGESDAESDLTFKMQDLNKNEMAFRRSTAVEPKAAGNFNQFLPGKAKPISYMPAPLRKKKVDRNEDNRRSWANPVFTEPDGTFSRYVFFICMMPGWVLSLL